MSEVWTVMKLLKWAQEDFSSLGVSNPRLEAEIVLGHALEKKRVELYTSFDEPVDLPRRDIFRKLVQKRREGFPVAYITGQKEFYSLDFEVNEKTLIPRPETEGLMDLLLEWVSEDGEINLCDVGTGSGVLAITFKRLRPRSSVWAIDQSEGALEMARRNAAKHAVEVDFRLGDLLGGVEEKFDVIVANLPYVTSQEWEELDSSVRNYEPKEALVGGDAGTEVIFRLVEEGKNHLKSEAKLLLEIGFDHAEAVSQILDREGYSEVKTHKDLAGLNRLISASWMDGAKR